MLLTRYYSIALLQCMMNILGECVAGTDGVCTYISGTIPSTVSQVTVRFVR